MKEVVKVPVHSVKQLADSLQISRQRVYQILRQEHVSKDAKGNYKLTAEIINRISKQYGNHVDDKSLSQKIDSLTSQVNSLLAQLHRQQMENDRQAAQNAKLLDLVDHAQQLAVNAQDETKQLKAENKRLLALQEPVKPTTSQAEKTPQRASQEPQEQPKKKLHWWQTWFNKTSR